MAEIKIEMWKYILVKLPNIQFNDNYFGLFPLTACGTDRYGEADRYIFPIILYECITNFARMPSHFNRLGYIAFAYTLT
jgi:hypothetical protein